MMRYHCFCTLCHKPHLQWILVSMISIVFESDSPLNLRKSYYLHRGDQITLLVIVWFTMVFNKKEKRSWVKDFLHLMKEELQQVLRYLTIFASAKRRPQNPNYLEKGFKTIDYLILFPNVLFAPNNPITWGKTDCLYDQMTIFVGNSVYPRGLSWLWKRSS